MDIKKLILYCLLAIVGMALWSAWVKDHKPANQNTASVQTQAKTGSQSTAVSSTPSAFNPDSKSSNTAKNAAIPARAANSIQTGKLIHVKTDLLSAGISEKGGDIVSLKLLKYTISLKDKSNVQMLTTNPDELYVVQSGLTKVNNQNIRFTSAKTNYQLGKNQKSIRVVLTGRTKNGLLVEKIYRFARNQYVVHLSEKVKNISGKTWEGSFYSQIKRQQPPSSGGGLFHYRTYDGAAISSPKKRYQKISYKEMDKANLSRSIQNGWIAMQQRYFVGALIPPSKQITHYYSTTDQSVYTIGLVAPQAILAPGKSTGFSAKFYLGPKLNARLKAAASGLDLTIDYGWLWMISELIFWVMQKINFVLGNWGWTIVLTTVLIKIIFYPLSATSYKSMARMREMQPRIKALKERFGGDKKAMGQATMELYRKEKINPLGGCLPMVIQIPVFIALYYVLFESVQLRQAPFVFWIHDLAIKDPYFILPILMGISMFWMQKLTPASPDPAQAKMMMFLPVIFTVFFATFPAGLVLYWLVNNLVSVLQQWYVMKKVTGQKGWKKT